MILLLLEGPRIMSAPRAPSSVNLSLSERYFGLNNIQVTTTKAQNNAATITGSLFLSSLLCNAHRGLHAGSLTFSFCII